jgi:hypothetical protein
MIKAVRAIKTYDKSNFRGRNEFSEAHLVHAALPDLQEYLGKEVQLTKASFFEDTKENTDYKTQDGLCISIRHREWKDGSNGEKPYLKSYIDQTTIREKNGYGILLEHYKIMEGLGDIFWYGWIYRGERFVSHIFDFSVYRVEVEEIVRQGKFISKKNWATTKEEFLVFNIADFSPKFVLRKFENVLAKPAM